MPYEVLTEGEVLGRILAARIAASLSSQPLVGRPASGLLVKDTSLPDSRLSAKSDKIGSRPKSAKPLCTSIYRAPGEPFWSKSGKVAKKW